MIDWIGLSKDVISLTFIAFGTSLPELVTWDEKHEVAKGVKYANIVAVAVEGIKAQQKQIKDLQTENDALRKDFASLQSQMDDLSAKMGQLLNVGAE